MIISALRVRGTHNKEEGVNLYAYHYDEPFPEDLPFDEIMATNSFPTVAGQKCSHHDRLLTISPGNNHVRAYIDIVSRDKMSLENAEEVLDLLKKNLPDLTNPVKQVYTVNGQEIFIKYATIIGLELQLASILAQLSDTLRYFMKTRVWSEDDDNFPQEEP